MLDPDLSNRFYKTKGTHLQRNFEVSSSSSPFADILKMKSSKDHHPIQTLLNSPANNFQINLELEVNLFVNFKVHPLCKTEKVPRELEINLP